MRQKGLLIGGCLVVSALLGCGSSGADAASTSAPAPASAPLAAFTLNPTKGSVPLEVQFTDTSSGSITGRIWTFGDGGTSTTANPTHTYTASGAFAVSLTVTGPGGTSTHTEPTAVTVNASIPLSTAWRFAVVGDTHVPSSSLLGEMASAMVSDGVKLVLLPGDIVESGAAASAATFATQLSTWKALVAPLRAAGIGIYPIRGNHEADANRSVDTWNAAFTGDWALPSNGPTAETNLTYSFTYQNAYFVGLDTYLNLHRVNQTWLDAQLTANTRPHVFVFGHEPAFKVFHADGLDDDATARDAFWKGLAKAGAKVYLCGHDHFFDHARIDDGDGIADNDLHQMVVGTGGGTPFDQFRYNGANSGFAPTGLFHAMSNGYLLVEVSGTGATDLGVSLSFRQRTVSSGGAVSYPATYTWSYTASRPVAPTTRSYPIVDTGQSACYNATGEIAAPAPGAPFYGQDGQHGGLRPSYQDGADGTVTDSNTGLMWVQARGSKVPWAQAASGAAACRVGGHADWRMPTLKELYSLIQFTGAQGPSLTSLDGFIPFIDTQVFGFAYGPTGNSSTGSRVIDCQDWSATLTAAPIMTGQMAAFGVNFADGRIKGYPTTSSNYVRYVRGNAAYGVNAFQDLGDGTVSDSATGLMWAQTDSGIGMDWQTALAWVQARNAAKHLGHDDWRMPNAKELQSLLDYSRAPLATDPSKRGPALDPVFRCTAIPDEAGSTDYPFYWTSTSFKDGTRDGIPAAYVAFGRALGWMQLQGSSTYQLLDVHGAGAQRSDPKQGSVTDHRLGTDANGKPVYGRGPQGDVVRIQNFVRLVRDLD